MPKISGPKYGCFSKLPHLPPSNNNSSFTSTYYQSYCLKHEKRHFHQSSNNIFTSQKLFAGRRSDYEPINQIKISTKLIAERYKKNAQLKEDTLNQRSWIGYRDPGIKAIEDYGINNIFKKKLSYSKSCLSLPIDYEKNYGISHADADHLHIGICCKCCKIAKNQRPCPHAYGNWRQG